MDQQRQSGGYRRLSWRFTKTESPGLVVGFFFVGSPAGCTSKRQKTKSNHFFFVTVLDIELILYLQMFN